MHYDSIQDFLIAYGFSIDQEGARFHKWVNGWIHVEIPFSAMAGETVASFFAKAQRNGWIEDETVTASPAISLLAGGMSLHTTNPVTHIAYCDTCATVYVGVPWC